MDGSSSSERPTQAAVEQAIRTLLAWMGEDPGRQGLQQTPSRVARSLLRLSEGEGGSLEELLERGIFPQEDSGMVLIRDLEFYSLCEHHLLPFYGRCHVAYIPSGRIIGFSRIPRLVDHFARRLQVQERLTRQVADTLEKAVQPVGVACMLEGFHLCMAMRGVEKQQATAVTFAYGGVFETETERRREFVELVHSGSRIEP